MLALIDIYSFIVLDLKLYLDTHPNCLKTKGLLTTFKSELIKIKDYYNTNFTQLTICDISPNVSDLGYLAVKLYMSFTKQIDFCQTIKSRNL